MSFLRLVITCIAIISYHVVAECRYRWLHYGSSCYYFSDDSRDWVSAVGSCRVHSAELVTVDSRGESDDFEAEVIKLRDGTDEFSEGGWVWASTGRPFNFTNWYPREPTGGSDDCLETGKDFKGKVE